jgi:hypothetical protein
MRIIFAAALTLSMLQGSAINGQDLSCPSPCGNATANFPEHRPQREIHGGDPTAAARDTGNNSDVLQSWCFEGIGGEQARNAQGQDVQVQDAHAPFRECNPGFARGCFWFSADYLMWWIRNGPVNTPLLTAGTTGVPPAALGQPGTVVLFGNNIDYDLFSGMRLSTGFGITPALAFEGSIFFLERRSIQFSAASDAAGTPVIGRPFFNNQTGLEDTFGTSSPGAWSGRTDLVSHTRFQGYQLQLAGNLGRSRAGNLDLLGGFRSLSLNEDLLLQDFVTPLAPGFLGFQGVPIGPPSTTMDFDRFHTRNNFYGGHLGARWQGYRGPLSLGITAQVALGATDQITNIEGASTLNTPGAAPVTAPGGVLAQTTNIGRHYRSVFSVVPETSVNVGWQITPRLSANVGYSFLYWSDVLRPGNQIDRDINPALPPTSQLFGNGKGEARPGFTFRASDFWAQGINFGLAFRY